MVTILVHDIHRCENKSMVALVFLLIFRGLRKRKIGITAAKPLYISVIQPRYQYIFYFNFQLDIFFGHYQGKKQELEHGISSKIFNLFENYNTIYLKVNSHFCTEIQATF